MQDKLIIGIKSTLQLFPFGIGGAIVEGYFGTIDERRIKKVELFLEEVSSEIQSLKNEKIDCKYFQTDEFAYYFEAILKRVSSEFQKSKLEALRGALVSLVVFSSKYNFEKQNHFLRAIEVFDSTHIEILKILSSRAMGSSYLQVNEIEKLLKVDNDSDKNFVYSCLDSLANKEFILSGPVPFDSKGNIAKSIQGFVCTSLGRDFLDFIRK